jgi:hypothetical protein
VPELLAGSKYQVFGIYQGMSFFKPFFFLLVDSSLVSTGVGFAGVEALSADCVAGWAEVAPGAAVSPFVPDAEELD